MPVSWRYLGRSDDVFDLVLRGMNAVEYFPKGIRNAPSYTCRERSRIEGYFERRYPLCLLDISIKTDQRKL